MKAKTTRQYTIRSVPAEVDRALRRRARDERKSLNEIALEALRREAGLDAPVIHHDLDFLCGSWEEDPAIDAALAAQNVVDPELWR